MLNSAKASELQSAKQINIHEFKINPQAKQLKADLFFQPDSTPGPGESPRFDTRNGILYFTDIDGKKVYGLKENGQLNFCHNLPARAGFITLSDNPDVLIIAQENGLAKLDISNGAVTSMLDNVEPLDESLGPRRLNDGDLIAFNTSYTDNPLHGRLVVGGISEAQPQRTPSAGLFVIKEDGSVQRLLSGLINSNGLGTFKEKFVHTDTGTGQITFYDVNETQSAIELIPDYKIDFSLNLSAEDALLKNKRPGPDGLVIDQDESILFVALYNAGKVVGIDPKNGAHLLTINVAAPSTTACEIVGSNLLITTGGGGESQYQEAGSVFKASLESLNLKEKPRGFFMLN